MKRIYPTFSAGIRVCFNGKKVAEIKDSREKAFSLVSKLGHRACVEFYDSGGIFDRIDYEAVLEIAKIQTPELVKKVRNRKAKTMFCFKCCKPKPSDFFLGGECGDCNNIVFEK